MEYFKLLRHIAVWPFVAVMLREGIIKLTLEDFKKPRGAEMAGGIRTLIVSSEFLEKHRSDGEF